MSSQDLLEKIESLPPERRAAVEDFVDFIASRPRDQGTKKPRLPSEFVERINARREQLLEEHGLFETLPLIREFRETGR